MTRFMTQKPCFNSVNDFPHTTFNWYVANIAFRMIGNIANDLFTAGSLWMEVR